MIAASNELTQRERELGAIIHAYNSVTERLKQSHEQLRDEVRRLHEEVARKNRQLRRRERLAALGEMAAGVAHEIRNPLGGIQMFASLLQRDLLDRPDAMRMVEKITKCISSLELIVTGILEFSSPREPQPTMTRLDILVHDVVEMVNAKAQNSQIMIETSDMLDEVELFTDSGLLQRALMNLLLNAVEATASNKPGGGCVTVDLRRVANDRVVLIIGDDGPGIAPELMDRIFNPFFSTKSTGTGLGLAIVHQIAEALGGNVQVANQPSGGACFSICLPLRYESNDGPQEAEDLEPRENIANYFVSETTEEAA